MTAAAMQKLCLSFRVFFCYSFRCQIVPRPSLSHLRLVRNSRAFLQRGSGVDNSQQSFTIHAFFPILLLCQGRKIIQPSCFHTIFTAGRTSFFTTAYTHGDPGQEEGRREDIVQVYECDVLCLFPAQIHTRISKMVFKGLHSAECSPYYRSTLLQIMNAVASDP